MLKCTTVLAFLLGVIKSQVSWQQLDSAEGPGAEGEWKLSGEPGRNLVPPHGREDSVPLGKQIGKGEDVSGGLVCQKHPLPTHQHPTNTESDWEVRAATGISVPWHMLDLS